MSLARNGFFLMVLLSFSCDCGDSGAIRRQPVDASGDAQIVVDGSRTDAMLEDAAADSADAPTNDSSGNGNLRGEVEAIVTTDNAYSFGWGSETSLSNHFSMVGGNKSAAEIFSCPTGGPDGATADKVGPERYVIPPEDTGAGSYLYIIAWSDNSVSQGALGQFRRTDGQGSTVYTGDSNWEVCATGLDYAVSDAPSRQVIDEQLVVCNEGSGGADSSHGWVNATSAVTSGAEGVLAIGEDNSNGTGRFPITCLPETDPNGWGISADARWMWYNPDPSNISDPFYSFSRENTYREFLIFRLSLEEVVIVR